MFFFFFFARDYRVDLGDVVFYANFCSRIFENEELQRIEKFKKINIAITVDMYIVVFDSFLFFNEILINDFFSESFMYNEL